MDEIEIDQGEAVTWEPGGDKAPVTFHLVPIDVFSGKRLVERLSVSGPPDFEQLAMAKIGAATDLVRGWSGIRMAGEPAPCTEETRRAFFSQRPTAMNLVIDRALEKIVAASARKNGSGGGSDSGSPTPTSSAGSPTTTEESAPATGAEGGAGATG